MDQDFVFPSVPDPKRDGALELPPQDTKYAGRRGNSKEYLQKIQDYNDRRGFVPPEEKQSTQSNQTKNSHRNST